MLVKTAVKWFSITIFLFFNLIANNQVLADSGAQPPPPIASTNVSTVSAGSAFTMKCEMPDNYTVGKKVFDMYFLYNINGDIADYTIPASTNGRNKRLFRTMLNDKDKPYITSIQPVNSTTTVTSNTFEISITTTKNTFSAQFFCRAVYNGVWSVPSNDVPITTITTIAPSSPPTLISSVSHVPLHHPFTLTCSLPNQFTPNNSSYQVAFLNSRDGLIADYEIEASGRVTLVSKEHVNSSAHLGTRAAFPTFDLEIREHVDRKLSYWCELITVDSVTQKKISAESVHWKPVGPFVDFAASAAGVERRGRCSIDELNNFSEKEYQVLFYSNLGPKSNGEETLLGFFWVRPHRIIEFVTETVTHWTSIVHGANINYPNFEIVTTFESNLSVSNNKWWCALNYTEPGQSSAKLIKSDLIAL